MPMLNLPTDVVRACVVAGDVDTPYYRVGRGEPVLMLVGDTATLSALLAGLPRDLRALAPNHHTGEFGLWLSGFLDALGIQRVAVVADASFALPTVAFARAEPDRVARLVIVGECPDGHLSDMSIPILRVGVSDTQTIHRTLDRIVHFVSRRGISHG